MAIFQTAMLTVKVERVKKYYKQIFEYKNEDKNKLVFLLYFHEVFLSNTFIRTTIIANKNNTVNCNRSVKDCDGPMDVKLICSTT